MIRFTRSIVQQLHSLRGRLAMLLLVSCIPLAAGGLAVVRLYERAFSEQVQEALAADSRGAAGRLDAAVGTLVDGVDRYADLPDFLDPSRRQNVLDTLQRGRVPDDSAGASSGRFRGPASDIGQIMRSQPTSSLIWIVDLDGRPLAWAGSGSPDVPYPGTGSAEFKQALRTGKATWGLSRTRTTDPNRLVIYGPMVNEETNQPFGLLMFAFDPFELPTIRSQEVATGIRMALSDTYGTAFALSNPAHGGPGVTVSHLRAIIGGGCPSNLTYGELQVALVGACADLPLQGGKLFLIEDQRNAFQAINQARPLAVGLIALSVLLAVTISLLLANRITSSLRHLAAAARAFARGDSSTPVALVGSRLSEERILADAFEDMRLTRSATRKALEVSEERFRSLARSAPIGIIETDLTGQCAFVNAALQRMTGLTLEASLGDGWLQAIHPDDLTYVRALMGEAATFDRESIEAVREVRIVQIETGVRWVRLGVGAENHGMDRLVMTVFDVTEQLKAESQLKESNRQLQVALDELQQTQQRIVEQERLQALGQMASGIAHDFNNVLAPILGFTDLLLQASEKADQKSESQAKARHYLEVVHQAAQDAAKIVERLSQLYRKHDGEPRLTELDLPEIAERAVILSRPRWRDQALGDGAPVTLVRDLEPVPPVLGDEAEIRQLALNLILNAVDAMPVGGMLTLRTRERDGQVELQVTDTGVGMSEETRRRCLEPFFTTKGERGSGLGLATANSVIQEMGGVLDIDSEEGVGTTVTVRLPVAEPMDAGETLGHERARTNQGLRVLAVDDEEPVRELVAEFLRAAGHTVVTASDGEEGLSRFSEGEFDLVVTDHAMPKLDGERLAAAIAESGRGTPVIMLTGFGHMMNAAGHKPEGVRLVVAKPITGQILRSALAEALG